ncbi:hypothetical protein EDD85DRAFT_784855 [Armillaria nabsnona]|nr:hypothetical protein EDD85DRAFT_784855 [Armillaria nabsnona]
MSTPNMEMKDYAKTSRSLVGGRWGRRRGFEPYILSHDCIPPPSSFVAIEFDLRGCEDESSVGVGTSIERAYWQMAMGPVLSDVELASLKGLRREGLWVRRWCPIFGFLAHLTSFERNVIEVHGDEHLSLNEWLERSWMGEVFVDILFAVKVQHAEVDGTFGEWMQVGERSRFNLINVHPYPAIEKIQTGRNADTKTESKNIWETSNRQRVKLKVTGKNRNIPRTETRIGRERRDLGEM